MASVEAASTVAAKAASLWEIKLMYALTNAGSSSISSFLTVYYQHTAGFSKVQIGILQTLPNFSSVVAPPAWGAVADYIRDQRRIHVFCIITGTLFYFGIQFFSWSFGWTEFMVVMARFQRCPSGSLLDHAVLDVLERAGGEYGKQRLFGAVGWGIGAYVTGLMVATGGIYWSFWTQLVLWYSSLAVLQRIPPVKYGDDDGGKHNTLERGDEERRGASEMKSFVESAKLLTKELDVLVLLGVVFLMGLMYGVIASFLTLNLYNLSGGDPRIVGIAVMCQTSSELPAFFFADRIIKKIGTVKVLLVSVLGYAVRIAYYTTMTNAWGAIPFEFLHGVTFGLAWAACTQYIYSASPRGCASTVMGVLNAVQNGLARAMGTLVGGYFYEQYGPRTMWLVTGLGVPLSLVGLGFFKYLKGSSDIVQEMMPLEEAEIFTPHGANPQPMRSDGYGSCGE
ncbi:Major Facilitator Superfamily (MFS) [Phytophthora cinnamomi]|uniref:Major Facilitator Superfamily (MFS) n=1 Tax=Phytophthora cinnamomi TaxID=4785 RepID=UPI00355A973C|nr:Major Facilitator Superfamily (MFS) [Phytophthora cinnamomi]